LLVKCSLHNHTRNSDGSLTPIQLIDHLRGYGYNAIAITDHNKITFVHPNDIPPGIVVFHGYEWTFEWHIIKLEGGYLSFLCHPGRWNLTGEQIMRIIWDYKLNGVEYCNKRQIQFKDVLPVLNLGVDDFHHIGDASHNWIECEVNKLNKYNVLKTIKEGKFTIKTGGVL